MPPADESGRKASRPSTDKASIAGDAILAKRGDIADTKLSCAWRLKIRDVCIVVATDYRAPMIFTAFRIAQKEATSRRYRHFVPRPVSRNHGFHLATTKQCRASVA